MPRVKWHLTAEVPEEKRAYITYIGKQWNKYEKETLEIFRKKVYFAQVAGKRFYLTWTQPSGDATIKVGRNYSYTIPDVYRKIVMKINDKTIMTGADAVKDTPIEIWAEGTGQKLEKFKSSMDMPGGFITLGTLPNSVSQKTCIKYIEAIQALDVTDLNKDRALRDKYQGLVGQLLADTYHLRYRQNAEKTCDIFHMFPKYDSNGCLFVYSKPGPININNNNKFSFITKLMIDHVSHGFHPSGGKKSIPGNFDQFWDIFGYTSSLNEGTIFEDLLDAPGGSSVRLGMLANQQRIKVRKFTPADLDKSGRIPLIENVKKNRYSNRHIVAFRKILKSGETFIAPVSRVSFYDELVVGWIWIGVPKDFSDKELKNRFAGWRFNEDKGGKGAGTAKKDASVKKKRGYFSRLQEKIIDAGSNKKDTEASVKKKRGSFSRFQKEIIDADSTINYDIFQVNEADTSGGDPINFTTGEFYTDEKPDFAIKGRGFNLSITRRYKSRLNYNGPLGFGWVFEHDQQLLFNKKGDILYFNGDIHSIKKKGNGGYSTPAGVKYSIKKQGTQYVISQYNNIKLIFSDKGFLIKKTDNYGNYLAYKYSGDNLIKVTDSLGRSLSFKYNKRGKITKATDFSGRFCTYQYDGDDMVRFTDLEGNVTTHEYLKNQDKPNNNHNMSRYTNPKGDSLKIFYYKNDKASHHTNDKGETFFFEYSSYSRFAVTHNERGYFRKIF